MSVIGTKINQSIHSHPCFTITSLAITIAIYNFTITTDNLIRNKILVVTTFCLSSLLSSGYFLLLLPLLHIILLRTNAF